MKQISIITVNEAAERLGNVVRKTPLQFSERLSNEFEAKIYIKREDLQEVRSYKIRGAYNKMSKLTQAEKKKGVVAASAGNHAQGVAFSARKLGIQTTIFMPTTTPLQKIARVKEFGNSSVEVRLFGHTYDEACDEALKFCRKSKRFFVHPFNDEDVIAGQATVGKEIYEELGDKIDYVLCPIGGGGFISGVSSYFAQIAPKTKIIGAEPAGAPSMFDSLKKEKVTQLATIDTFVDGAAVKMPGDLTFEIVKKNVAKVLLVEEGQICTTMIELYQNEGIVAEPAGALSISALRNIANKIKGKTVVCVLSGGNNDILRYPEVMERSLVHSGKKHYLLLNFAQKPGQLKEFVNEALGPSDDIVRFEYIKKTSKEKGPALVGLEFADKKDYPILLKKLEEMGINYAVIEHSDLLYNYLI
jgi:threonine dehydratase